MKQNQKEKISKVLCLTPAMGGAELILDGGSLQAAVITGSFSVVNETETFSITITNIPRGGTENAEALINNTNNGVWWSTDVQEFIAAATDSSTGADIVLLAPGALVGPSLDFGNEAYFPNGNVDGYVGFRFENGADDGTYHYGFVRAVGTPDGIPDNGSLGMLSLTQYASPTRRLRWFSNRPAWRCWPWVRAVWPCTAAGASRSNLSYHRPRSCFKN